MTPPHHRPPLSDSRNRTPGFRLRTGVGNRRSPATSRQAEDLSHVKPASVPGGPTTDSTGHVRKSPLATHRARALLLVAVLLLVLLVVADRFAAYAATQALASRIQSAEGLTHKPRVRIGGFPFLTQVAAGRYSDVTLSGNNIQRQGAQVAQARVQLHGVHVSISDVLRGRVSAVPLDSGTGTARLTFADINGLLRLYGGPLVSQLHVTPAAGGQIKISGPLGLSLTATATIARGALFLTPDPTEVAALPGAVGDLIDKADKAAIPIPQLPFDAKLVGGHADSRGISLSLTDAGTVLRTR